MKHSHAAYLSACLQEHPLWAAKRFQPFLGVIGVLIPGMVVLEGLPNPALNVDCQEDYAVDLC